MRSSAAIVPYSSSSSGTLVDEEASNRLCIETSLHNTLKNLNFRLRWHGLDGEKRPRELDIEVM
jgi:hypothetical protein